MAPPAPPVETSVVGGSDSTSVLTPGDTTTITTTASTSTDATASPSLTAPATTSATEPTGTQSSTSSPSGQSGGGPGAGSTTGALSLTGDGSGGSGGALAGAMALTQTDGATTAPPGVVSSVIDPNANTSSGLSPPADWATNTTGSNAHVIALGINGSNYQLTVDGTVKTAPIASVSSITITGTPNVDDTLTVDLSGGPILVPISFDGGVAGYDTLVVTGTNADLTSVGTGPNSGTFTVGATVINYAGLEPVTDTGTPGNVVLTTSSGDDHLTLTDVGGGNLKLHSTGSVEDTLFSDASTSVTINLNGGNDTIDVTALGPFAGSLTINGGTGADTFSIHGLGSYAGAIHLTGGTGNDVFKLGDAFGAVTITDATVSNTLDFTSRDLVANPLTVDGSKNFASGDGSSLTQTGTAAGTIDVTLGGVGGVSDVLSPLIQQVQMLEQTAEGAITQLKNALPLLPVSENDSIAKLLNVASQLSTWAGSVSTALTGLPANAKLSAVKSAIPTTTLGGLTVTEDYRGAASGGDLEVLLKLSFDQNASVMKNLDFGALAQAAGLTVTGLAFTIATEAKGFLEFGATTDSTTVTPFLDPSSNISFHASASASATNVDIHLNFLDAQITGSASVAGTVKISAQDPNTDPGTDGDITLSELTDNGVASLFSPPTVTADPFSASFTASIGGLDGITSGTLDGDHPRQHLRRRRERGAGQRQLHERRDQPDQQLQQHRPE